MVEPKTVEPTETTQVDTPEGNKGSVQPVGVAMLETIKRVHAGVIPEPALEEILKAAKSQVGYHCRLVTAAGGLFYCNFNCETEDGRGGKYQFNNSAWGIGSFGGGGGAGTLYTDYTMEGIARRTTRCSVTVTIVSVLATFHSDDSTLLATLTAGGFFPGLAFTGGGAGTWSKVS